MKVFFAFLISVSFVHAKKRFIVHYKKSNLSFSSKGSISDDSIHSSESYQVVKLSQSEAQRLKENPVVEYVEEDIMLHIVSSNFDNNPYYNYQWNLHDSVGGISLQEIWQEEDGHNDLTIAVIDTGILNHKDISSKLLSGADLISDISVSNDGNARDMDPSDPGDWVEEGDSCFQEQFQPSTWHGSHVAGIIGAINNSKGVIGVNANSKIMPIRALGKCGGYLSDVADAIRWAAGGDVQGVSKNTNPAQVINLSLGGVGTCSQTMQGAIDFARSKGAVVVVAAGNSQENLDEKSFTPANCQGVIVVGASNKNQYASSYSNYGSPIDVYAPGGDSLGPIYSLSNTGNRGPQQDAYVGMSGTSMAAPHITAIVSLMMSANPELYPYQIEEILRESATTQICDQGPCRGFVDGKQAIIQARLTQADESFVGYEPISPSTPVSSPEGPKFTTQGGAACASLGRSDSSFFRTMLLGGVLVFFSIALTNFTRKILIIKSC